MSADWNKPMPEAPEWLFVCVIFIVYNVPDNVWLLVAVFVLLLFCSRCVHSLLNVTRVTVFLVIRMHVVILGTQIALIKA